MLIPKSIDILTIKQEEMAVYRKDLLVTSALFIPCVVIALFGSLPIFFTALAFVTSIFLFILTATAFMRYLRLRKLVRGIKLHSPVVVGVPMSQEVRDTIRERG